MKFKQTKRRKSMINVAKGKKAKKINGKCENNIEDDDNGFDSFDVDQDPDCFSADHDDDSCVSMSSDNSENDDDDDEDSIMDPEKHKQTLENLKQNDPEFYEYLQKHDKQLLDFDDKEIEDDFDDDNDAQGDDEELTDQTKLTITIDNLKEWKKILNNPTTKPNCLLAIKSIIKAFREALKQTQDSSDNHVKQSSIMNPTLFNMIINTCLTDLLPAISHYLGIKNIDTAIQVFDPRKSRNWKRILPSMKVYLTDVLKMMSTLSSNACLSFNRHLLELVSYYQIFLHLLKKIIRLSIQEWQSNQDERSRILAFLIIYRCIRTIQMNDEYMTKIEQQTMINHILRQLYSTYVLRSKTTNDITIKQIQFMRNSLIELYQLEPMIAYQQCFIFTRQLAINIRKSLMMKEKDSLKRIYNWQFVQSINLWSQLIGTCYKNDQSNEYFEQLILPITNISLETLRIFSAFRYVPYRLQIIESLIKLSSECNHYIPILRLFNEIIKQIVENRQEILNQVKLKKKNRKSNKNNESKYDKKPFNLDTTIKLTKEQSLDMEFIEKLMHKIYELLLYYLKSISNKISFPEIVTLFSNECRKQIKFLPYRNGQIILKQLLDKTMENVEFIIKYREGQTIFHGKLREVLEEQKIESIENELLEQKTPLIQFYDQWRQLKSKQSMNNNDNIDTITKESVDNELKNSNNHELFDYERDVLVNSKNNNIDEESMDEMGSTQNDIDGDIDDDDDGSIKEFDEDDEIELTEEQMKKIQAKIAKDDNRKRLNTSNIENNDGQKKKRKRNKKNRKKKKARSLNPNLQLEGAFELSSDDNEDGN